VKLRFLIAQNSRDAKLMESLISYLGCGYYSSPSGYKHGEYIVTKFADITNKILPFFDKYPLVGAKRQDYLDFKRIAELMKEKAHLTTEGLEQIKQIKSGMNRGRSSD
jgi:hypothetical protein